MNTAVNYTAGGLLRIRQAAQILGVSEWTIRQMAHEGEIKFVRRTDRSPMLFSPADLEAWVRKNRQ